MATELLVAIESFVGDLDGAEIAISRGFTVTSDHKIAKAWPSMFVPHAAGEQAAVQRRNENEAAQERLREKQRTDAVAARIARGNRIDPSDDATTVAAKTAAHADSRLELVYDAQGFAIGTRPKGA